eukprot:s3434_g5.t1
MWDDVLQLLQMRLIPDLYRIPRCISACGWASGLQLLEVLRVRQQRADVVMSNSASGVCGREAAWNQAIAQVEGARCTALEADVFTYNIIISAHERQAERLARAWRDSLFMLRHLEEVELEADLISDNTVLSSCSKAQEWQQASGLLGKCQLLTMQLDVVTFSSSLAPSTPWQLALETLGELSVGGSLAVALKLLSWADRAEQLALPFSGGWHLDTPSFVLGLFSGVALFFLIELWFTIKWVVLAWAERRGESATLRAEVTELREEVGELRAALRLVRRELREVRQLVVARDSRSGEHHSSDSREGSYSYAGGGQTSRSPVPSPLPSPGLDRAPSVAETNGPTTPSNPGTPLTWIEREAICDRIGQFIARALQGQHRGVSGREQLPHSSRIWIVVRDFEGLIYTPVRVFRTWTSAKRLVKPNNIDPGDSVFIGLPSEREARRVVIQIAEFEGKVLVAVPASVWHRTVARRILPAPALSKPTPIEVAAASAEDRSLPLEEISVKAWVGFLRHEYIQQLEILEEADYEFFFEYENQDFLPSAQGLVEVAQEHFAFFSAEGTGLDGDPYEEDEDEPPEIANGMGEEQDAGSHADARIDRLEEALAGISVELKKLASGRVKNVAKQKAKAKAASSRSPARLSGLTASSGDPKVKFPLLDPGVVAAAIQAGIPESNLEQMQRLLSRGKPATKIKDMNAKVKPDYLSEDEAQGEPEGDMREGCGLAADADPLAKSVEKLTAIVELLTEDRKKKAAVGSLDSALDGSFAASSEGGLHPSSGKKAAAARRSLRTAFEKNPEEIYTMVEKLMSEDLNSQTLGPGQQPTGLSARAWIEFRSRISNYRTSVFCSWAAGGILDSLMSGDVAKARARTCLLILMLDQASIDFGSWTLAGELSLEGAPPFSSFAKHVSPSVKDGEAPFSRLLDPRWAELAMAHLEETDKYLVKRKNLGRGQVTGLAKEGMGEEKTEQEPRRKPKAKPKAKSQGASGSGE